MKIDFPSVPPSGSGGGCAGGRAAGFLEGGISGESVEFSSMLNDNSQRDFVEEQPVVEEEKTVSDSGRAAVEALVLTNLYLPELQSQSVPAPDSELSLPSVDIGVSPRDAETPLLQSSAQISFRLIGATDQQPVGAVAQQQFGEITPAPGGVTDAFQSESIGQVPVQEDASEVTPVPQAVADSENIWEPPSFPIGQEAIAEAGSLAPQEASAELLAQVIPANVAEEAIPEAKAPAEKGAWISSDSHKSKNGDLVQGPGTPVAAAPRGMTAESKSLTSELSLSSHDERSAKFDVSIRSSEDATSKEGETLFAQHKTQIDQEVGARELSEAPSFTIGGQEAIQGHSTAPAPAVVATNSHARFEPIFRALGEVAAKMRHEGPGKIEMELQLDSGEMVRVRLELHHGGVKAVFRTETGDFQQALQQGWVNFSKDSATHGFTVSDATFETVSKDGQANANQQGASGEERERHGSSTPGRVAGSYGRHNSVEKQAQDSTTTHSGSSNLSLWA